MTDTASPRVEDQFNEWCILELMGRRKLAGRVSQAVLGGGSLIRIDVPGPSGDVATQFYSPAAIYCITPVQEDVARRFAAGCQPEPVTRWELPQRSGYASVASDCTCYGEGSCDACVERGR